MKHIGLLIFMFVAGMFPVFTHAQADSAKRHEVNKLHKHVAAKKELTPEEKKKAAVRRTLKEKNFHLPDTAGKHQKAK